MYLGPDVVVELGKNLGHQFGIVKSLAKDFMLAQLSANPDVLLLFLSKMIGECPSALPACFENWEWFDAILKKTT